MHKITLAALVCFTLGLTGCTKQETKENLRNIGGGMKNVWEDVKEGTAEGAKKFNESTR
ncbi:MAG: hypothetical protein R3302_02690 [Sulfurimonadaceae bacterium]|nr:hypothetical protein [Sulfurimonadaceae bacterium]